VLLKNQYIAFGYIQSGFPYGVRTMLLKNQYIVFGYIQNSSPYGVRIVLLKKQYTLLLVTFKMVLLMV
jgi:hypothetical protein